MAYLSEREREREGERERERERERDVYYSDIAQTKWHTSFLFPCLTLGSIQVLCLHVSLIVDWQQFIPHLNF